jgi:hypothetical protein
LVDLLWFGAVFPPWFVKIRKTSAVDGCKEASGKFS